MSSSPRLLVVVGVRILRSRLFANDGHTRVVPETVPLCANGHSASSRFCPKCGAPVADVVRDRVDVVTLAARLDALEFATAGVPAFRFCLGDHERPSTDDELIVGVPLRLGGTEYLKTAGLSAWDFAKAIQDAKALCAKVGLEGDVALHVAAWVSY